MTEYYLNNNECTVIPSRGAGDKFLQHDNYLSEFVNNKEKKQARENLGITGNLLTDEDLAKLNIVYTDTNQLISGNKTFSGNIIFNEHTTFSDIDNISFGGSATLGNLLENTVHKEGDETIRGTKIFYETIDAEGGIDVSQGNIITQAQDFSYIKAGDNTSLQDTLDRKYELPDGGIPKSDLSQEVQNALRGGFQTIEVKVSYAGVGNYYEFDKNYYSSITDIISSKKIPLLHITFSDMEVTCPVYPNPLSAVDLSPSLLPAPQAGEISEGSGGQDAGIALNYEGCNMTGSTLIQVSIGYDGGKAWLYDMSSLLVSQNTQQETEE